MPFVTPFNATAGVLVTEANLDNWSDNLTTGVVRPIAETTLGSATASVTFSSIPATFRNLYLVSHARATNVSTFVNMLCRFNADATAANYHSEALIAGATTVSSAEQTAMTGIWMGEIPSASASSGLMFGGFELRVYEYQSAQQKMVISNGSSRWGGAGSHFAEVIGAVWNQTAVITSITVLPSAGNLETGSRFTLYGEPGMS